MCSSQARCPVLQDTQAAKPLPRGAGREIRTKGQTRPPGKRATAGLRRATGSPETRRTQRPGLLGRGRLLGGGGVSTRSQPQVKTPAGPHDEMLRSRGEPRSTGCRTSDILPPVLGSALLTFRWQSGRIHVHKPKTSHLFMMETLNKRTTEGKFLDLEKGTHKKKPTANIALNDERQSIFLLNLRKRQGCLPSSTLLNVVLEF